MNHNDLLILCVDGDAKFLSLIETCVVQCGFGFRSAETIDSALKLLEQEASRTAVIICEYKIGNCNALEFKNRLNTLRMNIPIAIATGDELSAEQISQIKQIGISHVLKKPINMQEIRQFLESESKSRIELIRERKSIEKIFIEESKNNLEDLEPLLLSLESDPENSNTLNVIFRLVHTIKGSSGCLENNVLYKFSHSFEDLLSSIKDKKTRATPQIISILLQGLETLKVLIADIETDSRQKFDLEELKSIFKITKSPIYLYTTPPQTEPSAQTNLTSKQLDAKKLPEQNSLRVSTLILDEFMELSGEISVIRNMVNMLVRALGRKFSGDRDVTLLTELLEAMHKINNRMQYKVIDMRKVPLKDVCRTLPRTVKELADSLNKEICVEIEGEDLRIDTTLSHALSDSLIHLMRNSADHGIEMPSERLALGKSKAGKIKIQGSEIRGEVIVKISDDGKGIDSAKILSKGIEKGLLTAEEANGLSESKILSLIFEPGFSTAAQVTNVSGRGVGMDMVKSSVDKVSGHIEVASQVGNGTVFTMHLPVPRSVLNINSLLVTAADHTFAVPQDCIMHLLRLDAVREKLFISDIHGTRVLHRNGKILSLVDLSALLKIERPLKAPNAEICILVLESDDLQYGLIVDQILDGEEIVVKPLAKQLRNLGVFAGATFLGVGGVCLILDAKGIANFAGLKPIRNSELQVSASASVRNDECEYVLFKLLNRLETFAVNSKEIHRLEELLFSNIIESGQQISYSYRGKLIPIFDLGELLQFSRILPLNSEIKRFNSKIQKVSSANTNEKFSALILQKNDMIFALCIDSFVDISVIQSNINTTIRDRIGIIGTLFKDDLTLCVVGIDEILRLANWPPIITTLHQNNLSI